MLRNRRALLQCSRLDTSGRSLDRMETSVEIPQRTKESEPARVDAGRLSSQRRPLGVYNAIAIRGLVGDERRRNVAWEEKEANKMTCPRDGGCLLW